jgi:hypothetical protein
MPLVHSDGVILTVYVFSQLSIIIMFIVLHLKRIDGCFHLCLLRLVILLLTLSCQDVQFIVFDKYFIHHVFVATLANAQIF